MKMKFLLSVAAVAMVGHAAQKPDVVILLIDSLKASHVGCYGYKRNTTPNLDRFAAENAIRFETVIPGGSWTQPSVMTLFTSLPADEHMRVEADKNHDVTVLTLAEVLRNQGYTTVGITANAMTNRRYGFGKGFHLWDDYSATLSPDAELKEIASGYGRGMVLTGMGINKLKQRNTKKPLFLFMFYMDPHWDFNPPSPYDRRFATTEAGTLRHSWSLPLSKVTPEIQRRTIDAYDGEIAYCDAAISRFIEELKKTPGWDNTLLIIAGDHGESFWERGFSGHGNYLYDQELKVPLFVKLPHSMNVAKAGSVIKGQVGMIDIAPTILELCNIEKPKRWKGESLVPSMRTGRASGRPLTIETRARKGLWQRAVRTDDFKLIAINDFSRPSEIYDLRNDPGETNNLCKSAFPMPSSMIEAIKLLKPFARK